jgi:hypothetical protein
VAIYGDRGGVPGDLITASAILGPSTVALNGWLSAPVTERFLYEGEYWIAFLGDEPYQSSLRVGDQSGGPSYYHSPSSASVPTVFTITGSRARAMCFNMEVCGAVPGSYPSATPTDTGTPTPTATDTLTGTETSTVTETPEFPYTHTETVTATATLTPVFSWTLTPVPTGDCAVLPLADITANVNGAPVTGDTSLSAPRFSERGFGVGSPDDLYVLDVPFPASVTISLCGSAFDTFLYLRGICSDGDTTVASNDDSPDCGAGSVQSRIVALLNTGRYHVIVDGLGAPEDAGAYVLTLAMSGSIEWTSTPTPTRTSTPRSYTPTWTNTLSWTPTLTPVCPGAGVAGVTAMGYSTPGYLTGYMFAQPCVVDQDCVLNHVSYYSGGWSGVAPTPVWAALYRDVNGRPGQRMTISTPVVPPANYGWVTLGMGPVPVYAGRYWFVVRTNNNPQTIHMGANAAGSAEAIYTIWASSFPASLAGSPMSVRYSIKGDTCPVWPTFMPTATTCPYQGTYGNVGPVGSAAMSDMRWWFTKASVAKDGTANRLAAYCLRGAHCSYRAALYSDNGGRPDRMLATSPMMRVAAASDWGWMSAPIPDTFLYRGDYWVGFWLDDDSASSYWIGGDAGGPSYYSNSQNGAPESILSPGLPSVAYDLGAYLDVCLSSPGTFETATPTYSPTFTPTVTETPTWTWTNTATLTPSDTETPLFTWTFTATPSETNTPTETRTPTATVTPSPTWTHTSIWTLTLTPVPTNHCASAPIQDLTGRINGAPVAGDTSASADDFSDAGLGAGGPDDLYQFSLVHPASVTISLCGSSFDTLMYLRSVCEDGRTTIAFNDDSNDCGLGSVQSRIVAMLDAGLYYLVVDGYGSGDAGAYQVDVTASGDPLWTPTPTPTRTPTRTHTHTHSPTWTFTPTITNTPTVTRTFTVTNTGTRPVYTWTHTPTLTFTITNTFQPDCTHNIVAPARTPVVTPVTEGIYVFSVRCYVPKDASTWIMSYPAMQYIAGLRLGIYADYNSGYPGALLSQSGAITVNAGGTASYWPAPILLPEGYYHLAVAMPVAGVTLGRGMSPGSTVRYGTWSGTGGLPNYPYGYSYSNTAFPVTLDVCSAVPGTYPTQTHTLTPTETFTPTETLSPTLSFTPTETLSPTETFPFTPTFTFTRTPTWTFTPTATFTVTRTLTPAYTHTLTPLPAAGCPEEPVADVTNRINSSPVTGTTAGKDNNYSQGAWGSYSPDELLVFSLDHPRAVTVSSCASSFDTYLYVRGVCDDPGTTVMANDDSSACGAGSLRSQAAAFLNAGTYYLIVDGSQNGGDAGAYSVSITAGP